VKIVEVVVLGEGISAATIVGYLIDDQNPETGEASR
jgi:hypothetical protein